MSSLEGLNPHLIKEKESRLVDAVRRNDVDLLKILVNSPELYNTTDSNGCKLLQLAICCEKKEVFDYLLSLPDYSLEFKNPEDETLEKVLYSPWTANKEYFACELIKNGACIDKKNDSGDTLLHSACKRGFVKASILLIEKGININACGYKNFTPLQKICRKRGCNLRKHIEIILMLLEFGADPSVRDEDGYILFEDSVIFNDPNEIQEALFYYTFDEFSLLEIHFDTLLELAVKNPTLFYEITNHQFKIIIDISTVHSCFRSLRSIKTTDLKTLITKYETSFKIFFEQLSEANVCKHIGWLSIKKLNILITKFETTFQFFFAQFSEVKFDKYIGWISVEKLNIFIENNFKDQMINAIIPLMCPYLGSCIITFYYNVITCQNESKLTEYICFLLSYGMELYQPYLHCVYKKFQYCDLFKILLHMDIKEEAHLNNFDSISASLFINVTKTLENFLEVAESMSSSQLKELMCYFAHPKLHSMYRKAIFKESFCRKTISAKSIDVPKIPSLLELSRNVFRSCFINKYQIKTSSQFYTLLNCLEINPVYKTIITYETKLYKP